MKILSFFTLLFFFSFTADAQMKLPKDFTCFESGAGHGLANTNVSIYTEDLSAILTDEDLKTEYLKGFIKTKDNLYTKNTTGKEFYYEIIIPETFQTFIIRAKKDKAVFADYSGQLLQSVKANRKSGKPFFTKFDGSTCKK